MKYPGQGRESGARSGDYRDMNENDISAAHEPAVDERFVGDWVAYGMSELQAYLTKHARFAAFCDELDAADAGDLPA
jgi:hypothetical protein